MGVKQNRRAVPLTVMEFTACVVFMCYDFILAVYVDIVIAGKEVYT